MQLSGGIVLPLLSDFSYHENYNANFTIFWYPSLNCFLLLNFKRTKDNTLYRIFTSMSQRQRNIDRLYKIIERHCHKYGPSLEATGEAYQIKYRIIWDQGTADEKVFTRFYVCPLCAKNVAMASECQIYQTDDFDRDHFPAASIGGRITLLVCKACNSRYGSELDYSGKEHHNYHGFLKNRAPMTAKLKLEGLVDNYTVELVRNDDTSFTFTDHHRNSYLMQQFLKIGIDKVVNKMPFQFGIRQRIPPAAIFEKSLLKAAYLYFFSVMGYDFAFSYVGTRIRRVLDGDEPHPLANHGVLTDLEDSPLE